MTIVIEETDGSDADDVMLGDNEITDHECEMEMDIDDNVDYEVYLRYSYYYIHVYYIYNYHPQLDVWKHSGWYRWS